MKRFNITVNGKAYDVQVEEVALGSAPVMVAAPAPVMVAAPAPVMSAAPAPAVAAPAAAAPAPAPATAPAPVAAAAGALKVESPMPGNILDVRASAGQAVKLGDVLVILEAMKMENEIVAPQDGTVAAIHVSKGDTVDTGTLLASLN